jgi:hypothetical protein
MGVGRASAAVFMLLAGLGLLTAAACGGGSSNSKDATATHTVAPAATASGTDASFVNDLCKAGRTFADSITATLKEPNVLSDPTALVSKLEGPYDQFAKSFASAKAPPDLVQWQKDTAKSLNDAVAKVKAGQGLSNLLSQGGQLVPAFPANARERLAPLVAKNSDCKASGLSFGT